MAKKERHLSHILEVLFFPLILITSLGLTACQERVILDQPPVEANSYKSDPDTHTPGPQSLAENFVLNSTVRVTMITIWGFYKDEGTPTPSTNNFTVIFHYNAAGPPALPGSIISAQTNVPLFSLPTGPIVGGFLRHMFFLVLPTPVTLSPGTYWVEIYNDTSLDADDDFYWETGTVDPINGIPNHVYSAAVPGSGWSTPSPPINLAIQILARDVMYAIPTFTQWGMIVMVMITGLGAVYFLRRYRRTKRH